MAQSLFALGGYLIRYSNISSAISILRLCMSSSISLALLESVDFFPKIAVKVANDMLTIGWTLLKKGELYNGLGDFSYLKRKLRIYKMTAIDSRCFGECLK